MQTSPQIAPALRLLARAEPWTEPTHCRQFADVLRRDHPDLAARLDRAASKPATWFGTPLDEVFDA